MHHPNINSDLKNLANLANSPKKYLYILIKK